MYYLIYGDDSFRSRQKLQAIVSRFSEKYGRLNVAVHSSSTLTPALVDDLLLAQSLLSPKRLVVLENVFTDAPSAIKDYLAESLPAVAEDLTVILYQDSDIAPKDSLLLALQRPGQAENFKPLTGSQLTSAITQAATAMGASIDRAASETLAQICGNDFWQIQSELAKLKAYASGRPIVAADVSVFAQRTVESKTFDLVDAIMAKNLKGANQTLGALLAAGEDPIRILAAITYQLRALVRTKDLMRLGRSPAEIAKLTRLHPFVVKKTASSLRTTSEDWPAQAYRQMVHIDWSIKTGQLEAEDGLTLLVTKLTGAKAPAGTVSS